MTVQTDYFTIATAGQTNTGRVRDHNEDSFLTRPESGVWVVADGMGGHDAGDYASQTITEELASVGVPISAEDLQARFMERLSRAHTRIVEHAQTLGGGTVGATLVGLLAHEDQYLCIWSGDSRIYLLRDGMLVQQTKDHTEVNDLLDAGLMSPEEAVSWPRRNVITRAIGVSAKPQCDIVAGQLQPGDVFLLCSDGLTEHNSDDDIRQTLSTAASMDAACETLIQMTLDRGAKDNVTAVVVHFAGEDVHAVEVP
ncbi:protein phosphatase [Cognatiyoonia koreensis]|uniref:Protein phosphatase n=1 Tax=Cognatiyoonia koreensis TaxID=364200 RepID=A0A1I0RGV6_9RHOB|nr:protein phosphatase 2C domain-containing protein [Cognatiyoonia koreensis]SEW40133.1 protein phosphatase [Cognatiyoonia koreensis]